MRVASRIVTPSLERVWRIPTKPGFDVWEIPLPFHVRDQLEAGGVVSYISEYLDAHTSRDAPDFSIRGVNLAEGDMGGRPCKSVTAGTRLLPYDSGVTQVSSLLAVQSDSDRWQFRITINRTGGSNERWIYLNHHFVDTLRKQLLLWKNMSDNDKDKYIKSYQQMHKS
jgi:hypothetical protein